LLKTALGLPVRPHPAGGGRRFPPGAPKAQGAVGTPHRRPELLPVYRVTQLKYTQLK